LVAGGRRWLLTAVRGHLRGTLDRMLATRPTRCLEGCAYHSLVQAIPKSMGTAIARE